jgi:hypothetical protein
LPIGRAAWNPRYMTASEWEGRGGSEGHQVEPGMRGFG